MMICHCTIARNGHAAVIGTLLNAGAAVEVVNDEGKTALDLACEMPMHDDHIQVAEILLALAWSNPNNLSIQQLVKTGQAVVDCLQAAVGGKMFVVLAKEVLTRADACWNSKETFGVQMFQQLKDPAKVVAAALRAWVADTTPRAVGNQQAAIAKKRLGLTAKRVGFGVKMVWALP